MPGPPRFGFGAYGHWAGSPPALTTAQTLSSAATALQSAAVATRCSVPFVSPPDPTHSNTRMFDTVPPFVKSLRTRMSPTVWEPVKEVLPLAPGVQPAGLWGNQEPIR